MKLLILGANNPEIVRLYEQCVDAHRVEASALIGFLDNDPAKAGKQFCGYPIFGSHKALTDPRFNDVHLLNAITRDAKTRAVTSRELEQYGLPFANLIHPSVDLRGVHVGHGLLIQGNVTIEADAILDDHVAIYTQSCVCHECSVGYASFIAPGCTICGKVSIGEEVYVKAGATVLPRLSIGDRAIIQPGALVTTNVEADMQVHGPTIQLPRKQGGHDA